MFPLPKNCRIGNVQGIKPMTYNSLEECLKNYFGDSTEIKTSLPVGGGDINEASCLVLNNAEKVFVKSNRSDRLGFFEAEEAGLAAIKATGTLSVPEIIGKGIDEKRSIAFLMMRFVEGRQRTGDFWSIFGCELAQMHLAGTGSFTGEGSFGFFDDNYIGATKQINDVKDNWIDFFRECRLEPQFKMAERYFNDADIKGFVRLLDRLPDIMEEPKKPSLLHGDLWSGNFIVGTDGKAWLIDPAAYVGHFEADLAMTELFGGFREEFYRAYNEVKPVGAGYKDRKEIYNLYHLMNHLNLFGPAYLSEVLRTVRRYS